MKKFGLLAVTVIGILILINQASVVKEVEIDTDQDGQPISRVQNIFVFTFGNFFGSHVNVTVNRTRGKRPPVRTGE